MKHPDKVQIIRIGMFHSNSVRGIALLVQKNLMRNRNANAELFDAWKASGKKFPEYFYAKNYKVEEDAYKQHSGGVPFRPTEPEDIKNAFKRALLGEKAAIINCLGPWQWVENEMPYLPEEITSNIHLIPADLEGLLL